MQASYRGNVDVVKALMDAGAKAEIQNNVRRVGVM